MKTHFKVLLIILAFGTKSFGACTALTEETLAQHRKSIELVFSQTPTPIPSGSRCPTDSAHHGRPWSLTDLGNDLSGFIALSEELCVPDDKSSLLYRNGLGGSLEINLDATHRQVTHIKYVTTQVVSANEGDLQLPNLVEKSQVVTTKECDITYSP